MRMSQVSAADLGMRDQLVMAHVGLVKAMASRMARRLPPQVEVSELIGVGVLGLIDAAGRYKPATGVPFDAFARCRIQGAMLDALRDLDWAPRSLRKLRRKVDATMAQLRHSLAREPEASDMATALEVSEPEYDKMLDQLRAADLASIRRAEGDDSRTLLEICAGPEEGPHPQVEKKELSRLLVRALGELPEREKYILSLYYEQELTLAEIGEVIGVGESRVSQLRTQAIGRLRTLLAEWLGHPVGA